MPDRAIRVRVAVCIVEDDRVLLVQHGKAGRTYWLLPGGGVEVGETLVEAAHRELAEETGLEIEVGRLVLVCEALQPAGRHILNLVFAGTKRGGSLCVGKDERVVRAQWVSVDELSSLEMYPAIGTELQRCCRRGMREVLFLGNVWLPDDRESDNPSATSE